MHFMPGSREEKKKRWYPNLENKCQVQMISGSPQPKKSMNMRIKPIGGKNVAEGRRVSLGNFIMLNNLGHGGAGGTGFEIKPQGCGSIPRARDFDDSDSDNQWEGEIPNFKTNQYSSPDPKKMLKDKVPFNFS
mmetsp:Transcript_42043/g.64426  ORF Transcript_42043/g.64426 Transcript_42043/m.64426 type:complete len:133 (-) Transcript_42043:278-676(-)